MSKPPSHGSDPVGQGGQCSGRRPHRHGKGRKSGCSVLWSAVEVGEHVKDDVWAGYPRMNSWSPGQVEEVKSNGGEGIARAKALRFA